MTNPQRVLPSTDAGTPEETVDETDFTNILAASTLGLWQRSAQPLGYIGGTPNELTAASLKLPLVEEIVDPMAFWVVPLYTNTSSVNIAIDGLAPRDVVASNGVPLNRGEFVEGRLYLLVSWEGRLRVVSGGGAGEASGQDTAPGLILEDQKAQNTQGGAATSGSWFTRTLNTVVRNEFAGADLVANAFTLPVGVFAIEFSAPAVNTGVHQSRLYNVTLGSVVPDAIGGSETSPASSQSRSEGLVVVSNNSPQTFRLEHRVNTTRLTDGLGIAANFGTEVYARVRVWKVGESEVSGLGTPGGAITLPFVYTPSEISPTQGKAYLPLLVANAGYVNLADIDSLGNPAVDVLRYISFNSTSSIRGFLRLQVADNQNAWALFSIRSKSENAGHTSVVTTLIASSSASPFVDGDVLLAMFTPNGDAGLPGGIGSHYKFSTTTTSPTTDGQVRLNALASSATTMYVNRYDALGVTLTTMLAQVGQFNTGSIHAVAVLRSLDNPAKIQMWNVAYAGTSGVDSVFTLVSQIYIGSVPNYMAAGERVSLTFAVVGKQGDNLSVSEQGLLASRPSAAGKPDGYTYLATDGTTIGGVTFGLLYRAQSGAWSQGVIVFQGRQVQLQTSATHIQWRLAGDAWSDLIPLTSLVQPAVLSGTSGSAMTIGTGPKSLTTQAGISLAVGQRVRVSNPSGTKVNEGPITNYTGTTLEFNSDWTKGSGADTDWIISIAGVPGPAGNNGAEGSSVATRVKTVTLVDTDLSSALTNGTTHNGVVIATGDTVLVASQANPALNGPYVVPNSGAASRHPDFATFDALPGKIFTVMEGTDKADTLWLVKADKGGTLGFTPITIQEYATEPPLQAAGMVNGKLVVTNPGNTLVVALKTAAGNDPSTGDPVRIPFKSAANDSAITWINVTSPKTFTISLGSTLGESAGPMKAWYAMFNDAGTLRLAAMNCLRKFTGPERFSIFPLQAMGIASASAEGGAGAADNAHTFYASQAITNKPYSVLGFVAWTNLAAPGTYASLPTIVQTFQSGVKLPGEVIQQQAGQSDAIFSGSSLSLGAVDIFALIKPVLAASIFRGVASVTVGASVAARVWTGMIRRLAPGFTGGNFVSIGATAGLRARAGAATLIGAAANEAGLSMLFQDQYAGDEERQYVVAIASSTGTWYINRNGTDTDTALFVRTSSGVSVEEVAT